MSQVRAIYDRVSRWNHWIVAILMIGALAFGFYVFRVVPRGPGKGELIGFHKALGLLILMLGVWRVGWRLRQGFIEPLHRGWQHVMAGLAHWVLLAGIVVLPLSGVLGSLFGGRGIGFFGLFTVPAGPEIDWVSDAAYAVHEITALAMVAAVALHIAGALKHQFLDRDGTLARMAGRA
ncbi:cytochrome b [Shimia marina]|uniref:Cytochrome b561 bacterial/Ni-hydrogenase domain-containing protein n=1 Tax=Shimia marina TaxID=321267 RepID=A0A0P1ETE1_9RHOB|nr:cytochrome b/b6 domain-containing protein [Shimia marina]CUH53512.1 hypothetical protein SHM7688_02966 [Shimia marina]SFD75372.1 cytochrome b561 [Shimia marina]